jgi:hypothetical protein
MIRRSIIIVALCAAAIFTLLAPACTGKTATNLPEPAYTAQITESLLRAINTGDYAAFSRDFDAAMMKAMPAESFKTQFTQGIQGKIGNYSENSKRFFQASSQAQYTTVVYYAAYSEEPGAVLIQISFKMVEGMPLVSGLFFNSPKLRG